jgi:hypothetical protein
MSSEDKEAVAFGKLLISMFAEFKRVEATLPEGFEPDELVNTIACADGDWRISVSRPSDEDVA